MPAQADASWCTTGCRACIGAPPLTRPLGLVPVVLPAQLVLCCVLVAGVVGHKNCADKKGGATSLDTFIALQPRQTSSAPRNGLANDAANVGGARAATTDAEGAYDLGAPPNAYDLGAPPNVSASARKGLAPQKPANSALYDSFKGLPAQPGWLIHRFTGMGCCSCCVHVARSLRWCGRGLAQKCAPITPVLCARACVSACVCTARGVFLTTHAQLPRDLCAGEPAHYDTYARGQLTQKAAGSHHYDVDFGEQPTQNAGYDHMHPDVNKPNAYDLEAPTDAEGAYDLGAPPDAEGSYDLGAAPDAEGAYNLGAPPNAYDLGAPPNVYDLGVPDSDSDVDL